MITKEYLSENYLNKNKTIKQISEETGASGKEIEKELKKYGIKKIKNLEFSRESEFQKPLTKEFLEKNYIILKKTAPDIMKEFNLSASKINKALKKFGIKKPAELKFKKGNAELKTKEALEKMYKKEGLSIIQIAERFGVTAGAVTSLFKRRGIPINKELRYIRRRNFTILRSARNKSRQNIKNCFREANRQKNRKGTPCQESTKLKISEKRIEAGVKNPKRTRAEILTRQLLKEMGLDMIQEQLGIKIFRDKKYFIGYIVDFCLRLKDAKYPIILQIDSEYFHGKIEENIERDRIANLCLTTEGFAVIRIPSELVSRENLEKCIDMAKKAYRPEVIFLKSDQIITNYLKPEYSNSESKLLFYNAKLNKIIEENWIFNADL
ncbi:MAG: hypothetical protein PHT51_00390 [Patescibacteria group bacterium]|nr:hypothetical protein [Patescibacteria group bacterium]MDD4611047.1 hypothetical protein [Patescibacteria group bacterium]